MKSISLLQPWATLVAIGAKRIETRSWSTPYRGPLAIHASAGISPLVRNGLCTNEPFFSMLRKAGYATFYKRGRWQTGLAYHPQPLGAIVATCNLVHVAEIHTDHDQWYWHWTGPDGSVYEFELTDQERAFGDYTPGRYAWLLDNIRHLDQPVPAKGKLGLWEWDEVIK